MKRRDYFKDLIRKNRSTNQANCEGKNVDDEPYIALEFFLRQAQLSEAFLKFNAEKGVQWLFGYANYINQNYGEKPNPFFRRTYTVGTLLMVDFFGGYGNELIFDHPAIVLKDLTHGLIVAPLTSTPDVYSKAPDNPLDIQLTRNAPPLGYLIRNSTIRLAQIRYISKKRILCQMSRENARNKIINQRVSDPHKLKEIEMALCDLFGGNLITEVLKEKDLQEQQTIDLAEERRILELEKESLALEKESFAIEKELFMQQKADQKPNIQ